MRTFLQRWFGARTQDRRTSVRLALEGLEVRQLLAAAVTVDMNTLGAGNDGQADVIQARRSTSGTDLEVLVNGQLERRIALSEVSSLSILGSADTDSVSVDSALKVETTVNGGAGADVLTILGNSFFVANNRVVANGKAIFYGEVNTLTLDGRATPGGGHIVEDTQRGVTTTILGGTGSDSFLLLKGARNDSLVLDGGDGADVLFGFSNFANHYRITGADAGTLDTILFAAIENLKGGNQFDDSFEIVSGGSISGTVEGGGGSDSLHYTGFSSGVLVDLTADTATAVAKGALGIENVTGTAHNDFIRGDFADNALVGGGGSDILIGMAGDDFLFNNGTGRSLLLGGTGADTLNGGNGEDLLIADTTAFDQDDAALAAIHGEWRNTSRSYTQRVDRLKAGFTAPDGRTIRLSTQTVFNESSSQDVLTGAGGLDWYWAFPQDLVSGKAPGERQN